VIASPVAAYFSGDLRPVSVWLCQDYTRQAGCASGEITEVFACGTAAVITPVGTIRGPGTEWTVGDGSPGPVTRRLRAELLGIQHGSRPDPYGWVQRLC
jgi:branched-chain amino acid aminotransferase